MLERLTRILTMLKDPRVPKLPRLLVLFAVIYAIIPTDLVPDVPIVGWLDDLVVLWMSLRWLLRSGPGPNAASGSGSPIDTTAERLP